MEWWIDKGQCAAIVNNYIVHLHQKSTIMYSSIIIQTKQTQHP